MLRSKLFDGLKRISTPFRTRNPHRDGARRKPGFRRPGLECLERRELLSVAGWSFAVGGPSDVERGWDTAVDTAGNVYVTGKFGGVVDFDPGDGVETLESLGNSQGNFDMFVAKYSTDYSTNLDGDAKLEWANRYDYQGDVPNPYSNIAVDSSGKSDTQPPGRRLPSGPASLCQATLAGSVVAFQSH